jgi:NAD(P) transhydrogenase subunit alpha
MAMNTHLLRPAIFLFCLSLCGCLPALDQSSTDVRPIGGPSSSVGKRPAGAEEKSAVQAAEKSETPAEPASKAPAPLTPETTAAAAGFNLSRMEALITAITIFVIACFVGYEVINKVPTTLHTPLMSGSNAISGITVVGALIIGGYSLGAFSSFVGFLAIVLAMINVVGGFLVTHRMLAMFKRK